MSVAETLLKPTADALAVSMIATDWPTEGDVPVGTVGASPTCRTQRSFNQSRSGGLWSATVATGRLARRYRRLTGMF